MTDKEQTAIIEDLLLKSEELQKQAKQPTTSWDAYTSLLKEAWELLYESTTTVMPASITRFHKLVKRRS